MILYYTYLLLLNICLRYFKLRRSMLLLTLQVSPQTPIFLFKVWLIPSKSCASMKIISLLIATLIYKNKCQSVRLSVGLYIYRNVNFLTAVLRQRSNFFCVKISPISMNILSVGLSVKPKTTQIYIQFTYICK